MPTYNLELIARRVVCEDVVELDFRLADSKIFSFVPGQYINMYAQTSAQGGHTGRSYTIASAPDDVMVRIAVRKRGEFSSFLHGLAIGATVIADGPHGVLCPQGDGMPFVCLAAGIGICPFLSWIRSRSQSQEQARMHVLVTNSTELRSPYVSELLQAASGDSGVFVTSFLTQQSFSTQYTSTLRRINTDDIKTALAEAPEAFVAICGSISFTRDMWKFTLSLGVPEERILTEAFF